MADARDPRQREPQQRSPEQRGPRQRGPRQHGPRQRGPRQREPRSVKTFLRFGASSLSATAIDLFLFQTLCNLLRGQLPVIYVTLATVLARLVSATYNYLVNYRLVFRSENSHKQSAVRFAVLAACVMVASALLTTLGVHLVHDVNAQVPELFVKMFVDVCLFFVNYNVQKRYVY